jgi:molybdate transport system substrate-binding protein
MRIWRWWMLAALAAGAAAVAAGCGSKPSYESSSRPVAAKLAVAEKSTITVLVPCGQVGPFSRISKLYEQQHPGVKIEWEQDNIVVMTKKVLDGKAKPDAFLSMSDLEMDQIQKAGLLMDGTRAKIAENSLAIVIPAANPGGVNGIEDFAKPSVKLIAVPDPDRNGVGKHTKEALEKLGIWDKVQKKILLPQYAADSKDLAAEGKVEAAIAYYPCSVEVHVKGAPPALPKNLKLVGAIPSNLYPEFACEAGVISGAQNPDGGKSLIEFLKTPEVQKIYKDWEFVREPKEKAAGT